MKRTLNSDDGSRCLLLFPAPTEARRLGEPVAIGQLVRAVVVKAGASSLHLRVMVPSRTLGGDDRDGG